MWVEGLQLASESRGASMVVMIHGDLDLVTGRQFDEYLARIRQQHRHVVLDLSAVDFLDTSSLAVIVGHWKEITAAGGTLALAGARYRYTKSLWITGLADRLPFYETVDKAVAAVEDGMASRPEVPS
ncbi:MAG TPA: STAS domain-containing protein [Streptosporangiaceae bacterium]|nr:STAS domain-containing protein [Streptosporangiaceae bacterium]